MALCGRQEREDVWVSQWRGRECPREDEAGERVVVIRLIAMTTRY